MKNASTLTEKTKDETVSDDDDIVVEMTASWSWRWPDSGQSGWSDLAPGP